MKYYVIFFLTFFSLLPADFDRALQEYQRGEKAVDLVERESAFNQALVHYRAIEARYGATGKLNYNMANTYFQLNEFARASLYYRRALRQRPRDCRIRQALQTTMQKLDLPEESRSCIAVSPKERWMVFTVLLLFGFSLYFFYLWSGKQWMRSCSFFFALLVGCVGSVFLYEHSIAAVEGVILEATMVYQDAGEHYKRVESAVLQQGIVVELLEVTKNKEWFKIVTPNGNIGFIQHEKVELI